jgi:hypothetical protein
MPASTFRAVAWEIDTLCARLAEGLFGPGPARDIADEAQLEADV